MRKRFKIVLNLDIENPDDPFPACGDFTHLNKMQGIIYEIMSYAQFYWRNQVKYSVTLDKVIDKGEIERMRSFSEQLRLLLQSPDKVEDQIGAILMMIDVQIIGNYEPTPRMSKTQDVEAWIKQDDYFSTRNALRKEQRAQLGPEWHERHIAMQGESE